MSATVAYEPLRGELRLRQPRRRGERGRGGARSPGRRPLIGLGITAVILRITWRSWQTVRAYNRQDHRHS